VYAHTHTHTLSLSLTHTHTHATMHVCVPACFSHAQHVCYETYKDTWKETYHISKET